MAQFNGIVKKITPIKNSSGQTKSVLILKNSSYTFFVPADIGQCCVEDDQIIIITTEIKKESSKVLQPQQIISIKIKQTMKSIFKTKTRNLFKIN